MAIDNEIKLRHLESRLADSELGTFSESVKDLSPEDLKAQIKALKAEILGKKILQLQDEKDKL